MPAKGLYIPFEDRLLQNALNRHVHSSAIPRKGSPPQTPRRSHVLPNRGAHPRRGAADNGEHAREEGLNVIIDLAAAGTGGPVTVLRKKAELWRFADRQLDQSVQRAKASNGLADVRRDVANDSGLRLNGYLAMQLPQWSGGPVRLSISKCLDGHFREKPGPNQVKQWLDQNSPGQQGLGVGLPLEQAPAAVPELQQGVAPIAPTRVSTADVLVQRPATAPHAFTGAGGSIHPLQSWNFLRHVPGGPEFQEAARVESKANKGSSSNGEPPMVQILYSDVVAILWARGGAAINKQQRVLIPNSHGQGSVMIDRGARGSSTWGVERMAATGAAAEAGTPAPSGLDLAAWVPQATAFRWKRLLRLPHDETCEALGRRLVWALAIRKELFHITAKGPASDEHALIQLQMPLPQTVGSGPESLRLDLSDQTRLESSARWLGALPLVRNLDAVCDQALKIWNFKVDKERLVLIAGAVERAESLHLCGGLMARADRIDFESMNANGGERRLAKPVRRRGHGGISSDWILAALSESTDEDHLESGDSIRLLTRLLNEEVRLKNEADPAEETARAEDVLLSAAVWRVLRRQVSGVTVFTARKSSLRQSSERPSGIAHGVTFSLGAAAPAAGGAGGLYGATFPLSRASIVGLGETRRDEEDDAAAAQEASKIVQEAEEALFKEYLGSGTKVAEPVAERAKQACMPMLLELLVQRAVSLSDDGRNPEEGGPSPGAAAEELVGEMLWQRCGWDFPAGRRRLRRLCRTFDRYSSSSGTMSKANFTKLCLDVGWASQRDHSNRHNRFMQIFSNAVGDAPSADFIDFLFMIEMTASEVVRPTLTSQESGALAGMWPSLDAAILQLNGVHAHASKKAGQALTARKATYQAQQQARHAVQHEEPLAPRSAAGAAAEEGPLEPTSPSSAAHESEVWTSTGASSSAAA